ncbi:family 2 glycosyl transferase [Chlorella sorokiniana]|uniref:Family 2 glycosyl transferase n=1 Tax=Chlorella sorokiniana TaxID=3076 RepID=A0A2P6TE76_CHLSO|nr:family 2 glycosyl transferase [Chlorella sorokiniana]|eukprot:PRW20932.1 family 2 glycosyl transferase [Chlorella sorokiniana]
MKAAMKAPEQQAILARDSAGSLDGSEEAAAALQAQLAALGSGLANKEAQLAGLSDRLAAAEQALLAAHQQGIDSQPASAAAVASQDGTLATRWACLAAQRQELAARWQCLAEERKQLSLLMQQAGRRSGGGDSGFQPGQFPVRDVRCAIISHQVDIPCGSCCFQR